MSGVLLVVAGIRTWIVADHTPVIVNNQILKFLRKRLRVTPEVEGNTFFVHKPDADEGKTVRWATPLLFLRK